MDTGPEGEKAATYPGLMTSGRPWFSSIVAVVVGSLLTLAVSARAESFTFTRPQWDGLAAFLQIARTELGKQRVVLEATVNWEQLGPEDALLVIHPQTDLSFSETSAFLAAGGRLGLLDDFGRGDDLLSRFQISRVAPPKSLESYRNNPALAIARPYLAQSENGTSLTHPIAEEVGYVVTNHPRALKEQSGVELTRVLSLTSSSGETAALAVVGVIGDARACGLAEQPRASADARCGRLFAMSDPSVLIDLMLRFEGNRHLARGLVRYLAESDVWGPRNGKLYIVANRFDQVGHFGGQNDWQRTVEAQLEDLHAAFRDLQRQGLPSRAAIAGAFLCAVLAGLWAWRSGGRLYPRPLPRYTAAQPLLAQGGLAGRSAVLSAPTTADTLRLLELRAALEVHLRSVMALPANLPLIQILQYMRDSNTLSGANFARLQILAKQLQATGDTLTRGRSQVPGGLTPAQVRSQLEEILAPLTPPGRRPL